MSVKADVDVPHPVVNLHLPFRMSVAGPVSGVFLPVDRYFPHGAGNLCTEVLRLGRRGASGRVLR